MITIANARVHEWASDRVSNTEGARRGCRGPKDLEEEDNGMNA